MLISEEVEVKLASNTKYYLDLGYIIPSTKPNGQRYHTIKVKVEDLSRNSHAKVLFKCDYCEKEIYTTWQKYCDRKENSKIKKDCCKGCWFVKCQESNEITYGVKNQFVRKEVINKIKETNVNKYGFEYYTQTDEYKKRCKETCMNTYGVDNISKVPEIIEKIKNVQFEKYGSFYSQTDEYKERYKNTCKILYGCDNVFQNEKIKEKSKETCIKKYGVEYAQQNSEVKIRSMNTLIKNGSINTSKQQLYLHNLFGGILNFLDFTTRTYSLDIAFPEHKIYIEYNGGGHDLSLRLGFLTEKQFNKKELDRYFYLKRNGWKQIKINSPRDYLPSDLVLIDEYNKAIKWFKSDEYGHGHYVIDIGMLVNDVKYGKLRFIS